MGVFSFDVGGGGGRDHRPPPAGQPSEFQPSVNCFWRSAALIEFAKYFCSAGVAYWSFHCG
jgi:hypothetical protein